MAASLGSLLLEVWILDYADSIQTFADKSRGANRILLTWLQKQTIEEHLKPEIAKQPDKILQLAWAKNGGQGEPTKDVLVADYLKNFMQGKYKLFVSAGTVLGFMYVSGITPNDGRLGMSAFFQLTDTKNPSKPVAVDAEDVLDAASSQSVFVGHPLAVAANGDINVHFLSTLTNWDSNKQKKFVPFSNGSATLISNDDVTLPSDSDVFEANVTTNSTGGLDFTAALKRRDLIRFEYNTTPKLITASHRARQHVDQNAINHKVYAASDDLYGPYVAFIESLDPDAEQFKLDRGNGGVDTIGSKSLSFSSQTFFLDEMKRFERLYRSEGGQGLFTVLFEGDSWLSYPPVGKQFGKDGPGTQQPGDIYGHLTKKFEDGLVSPLKYVHWPLQHHGDRSDQMFGGADTDNTRQWHHTLRILKQRKVDLVICSAGGNDMAEPGISHWLKFPGRFLNPANESPIVEVYKKCFVGQFKFDGTGAFFDPGLMDEKGLTSDQQIVAKRLINKSFAVLLRNHPWALFQRGGTKQNIVLDAADNGLLDSYGAPFDSLEQIGKKVIADNGNHQKRKALFLKFFHDDSYTQRLDQIKTNWVTLLEAAKDQGTVVVTHTYCYPLFSKEFTEHFIKITGPWFAPRFEQAGIIDQRIRSICLRVIIDDYKIEVLDKLRSGFDETFSFADVRALNGSSDDWSDEMHLSREGFKRVADELFKKVKERFPGVLK
jgi:lysophospholipase L1-like esterase